MEMTKKELVKYVLESMGYHPAEDNDGDLKFRFQMKELYAIVGDDDWNYVIINLPQFATVINERHTLCACNRLTRDLKLVKAYIDHTGDSVSASCEFFYTDEGCLRTCLEHSLALIGVARTVYERALAEVEEDAKDAPVESEEFQRVIDRFCKNFGLDDEDDTDLGPEDWDEADEPEAPDAPDAPDKD